MVYLTSTTYGLYLAGIVHSFHPFPRPWLPWVAPLLLRVLPRPPRSGAGFHPELQNGELVPELRDAVGGRDVSGEKTTAPAHRGQYPVANPRRDVLAVSGEKVEGVGAHCGYFTPKQFTSVLFFSPPGDSWAAGGIQPSPAGRALQDGQRCAAGTRAVRVSAL
jgi:hypothetical protein